MGGAAALAKRVVARWRKAADDEKERASQVASALEQALWEELATEEYEHASQHDTAYESQVSHVAGVLASDHADGVLASLRQRALNGASAHEVVEEALESLPSVDSNSFSDNDS